MTGILIPAASETEWLNARRHGVTASEIAAVMGLSPASQDGPYALYHRKTGTLPPIEDNDAMERGRVLEPYIAGKFAERRPEFIVDGDGRQLYAHPDRPWQMATPDRLLQDAATCGITEQDGVFGIENIAVLETKSDASPGEAWGEDGTDEIPVHYRCQVLWQMDVMGVSTAFVACLFIQTWKLRVYELTMDDAAVADLKLMREEARDFLDRIDLQDPPDVDWRPATAATLKHLHPSVEDRDVPVRRKPIIAYRAACKAYKAAEQRKKLAENRLRLLLGDGHRITDERTGEVIARRDVYPVKEHTRKASLVDKLVPVKDQGAPIMTTRTVSKAVEKQDTGPAALIRQSRGWFATVVPTHIDAGAFVALAVAYLRKNPKLAEVAARNPDAFMAALSECARLGLVPGDTYHLVPFGNDITGIIDYTGEIELIYRAGAVASVKAEIVYARDLFRFTTDMDRPEHAPDWFGDRGELIGAYAYAVMKDGATSKVVIYSRAEIDRVKAVSKGAGKQDSPWVQWYDRMALKTVIHRLEHFVPTSAEYRREQLRAAAEISQQVNSAPTPVHAARPASEPHEVVDAEVVDDHPDVSPAEKQVPGPAVPPAPHAEPAGETPDRTMTTVPAPSSHRNSSPQLGECSPTSRIPPRRDRNSASRSPAAHHRP